MKPVAIDGFFKRGSTWRIGITRKDSLGVAIDMTGLDTRSMFRESGIDGAVILTLDDAAGIEIADPATGAMVLVLTAIQSALFAPGAKVYFDIEQTNSFTGEVWQSLTYYFKVDQEVTRDV